MKALILAAGEGTRLRHLTSHRPKPMLPIHNRPLLAYTIEWLRHHHIDEIALNLHHCPTLISNYFGDGRRFGVSITYSSETDLMGTAGAAKQLQSFLTETFVVVYGDVFTNLDLSRLVALHINSRNTREQGSLLTMALHKVSDPSQCGLVQLNDAGRVTHFVEKPLPSQVFTQLAFSGIAICEPALLSYIPANAKVDFGHDLIPKLIVNQMSVFGQEIKPHEFVIDIGTLNGYLNALHTWSLYNEPHVT